MKKFINQNKIIKSKFRFESTIFGSKYFQKSWVDPSDELIFLEEKMLLLPDFAGKEYFKNLTTNKRFHLESMIDHSITILRNGNSGYYHIRKIKNSTIYYANYHNKIYRILKEDTKIDGYKVFNATKGTLLWISIFDLKFLMCYTKNK